MNQEEKVESTEDTATEEIKGTGKVETKENDFMKRVISVVKSKIFLIIIAVLVYTAVVAAVTVKIDRKVIARNFQKGLQEAFQGIFNSTDNLFSDENENSTDYDSYTIENKANKEDENPEKKAEKIALSETVTIGDVMVLTFESAGWADEIKPSDTSDFYSYYEDKEGEKYFVIRGKVKNIAGDDLDIGYANQSKIVVNDKYKADIRIEVEESDGTSFYGDVKPLQTLNIVAYASLSDEVFNICKNIRCEFDFLNDSAYINEFFDDDMPHDSFYIDFDNSENNRNEE